jgi:hypothetical protein
MQKGEEVMTEEGVGNNSRYTAPPTMQPHHHIAATTIIPTATITATTQQQQPSMITTPQRNDHHNETTTTTTHSNHHNTQQPPPPPNTAPTSITRHASDLAEVLPGVGVVNLARLVRVEPDLALAALEHARGEALLQLKRHHRPCKS